MFKNGLIIILAGVFAVPAAFTQNIQVASDKTLGGVDIDYPSFIKHFSNGEFFIVGSSKSPVGFEKLLPSYGGEDYWFFRINVDLQITSQFVFGGAQFDVAKDLIIKDDNIFICGNSGSGISGNKSVPSLGSSLNSDFWLVKTDMSGNDVLQKVYGGSGDDNFTNMLNLNNDLILLGGFSDSDTSIYKTEMSKGLHDIWFIVIDSLGNKVWDKTLGGNQFESNSFFTSDSQGNILAAAQSNSGIGGDKTVPLFGDPNQSSDIWVVKLSPTGQKIWDIGLGGTAVEELPKIIAHDGFYYMVCASGSPVSGNKTAPNIGNDDIWVVKLDTAGNIIWDKTYGGTGADRFPRVSVNSLGQLVVVCTSGSGISGNKTEPSKGGSDYWVFALNAGGEIQWQKTIGGSGNDSPGCPVLELPDNRYAVFGYSLSGISGDKTESNRGGGDIWGVILQTDLSTSQTDWEAGVNLYPVPAQNQLTIDIKNTEQFSSPYTVSILDVNGRPVIKQNHTSSSLTLDISGLNPGVYVILINTADGRQVSRKMVVNE
jgi:hypothetical protein